MWRPDPGHKIKSVQLMIKKCTDSYNFKLFEITLHKFENRAGAQALRPRSGHRMVGNEHHFYVYGGYNERIFVGELLKYNIVHDRWDIINVFRHAPKEGASYVFLMHGKYLFLYGGTGNPFGLSINNVVHRCDMTKGTLRFEPINAQLSNERPMALYGQAAFFYKDYFYTLGGTNGHEYFMDMYRLNFETNAWETEYETRHGDDSPAGRFRHEIALDDHLLYVFGGGDGTRAFGFNELPVYNLLTHRWDYVKTLGDKTVDQPEIAIWPSERYCHCLVHVKKSDVENNVFIFGGRNMVDEAFQDLWRYNIPTNTWTKVADKWMLGSVFFSSAWATPEGKLFIFGGVVKANPWQRTNLLLSTWISVPSLSEMCWEAFTCQNQHLVRGDIDLDKLVQLGIPDKFINRLRFKKPTTRVEQADS